MVPHGVGEEEEARGAGRDLVGDPRGRRALLRVRANRSFGGARGREGGEVTCGAPRSDGEKALHRPYYKILK